MKALDRWLQRYRFLVATPWIPGGARLLDVGCHQGELLNRVASRVRLAVGIDPLANPRENGNLRVHRGRLPCDHLEGEFDVITMLAVLEHVGDLPRIAERCLELLAPGGRVVITVPNAVVDRMLTALLALRLIDGMSLEEHHGFRPDDAVRAFQRVGLNCIRNRRFQFGLNNLFVLERSVVPALAERPEPRPDRLPACA